MGSMSPLNPRWKARLAGAAAALFAAIGTWQIANGSYAMAVMLGVIAAAACLNYFVRVPLDTVIVGVLLVGYIVGNRGFAQLSLVPGLPILPAEAGLALCLGWLALRSAVHKQLPFQRDLLNFAIVLWIVVGSVRILPDVRIHGAMALRDFAMVSYALFFFVGQSQAAEEPRQRFLSRCLLASVVLLVPLFELFRRFPDFFLSQLTLRGTPLIFLKSDLAAAFLGIGVILTHERWERTRHPGWLILALLAMLEILASENRAALLGLAVATGWLIWRGQWSLVRTQAIAGLLGVVLLLGAMTFGAVGARTNPAYQLFERVASMTDFTGQRTYASPEVEFKGDNNQFRLVWWSTVIGETYDDSPWIGLGFGHDLAAGFVRRYYPDNDEEFSTRSPHSILVTVFGRMGIAGTLAFLGVILALAVKTSRTLRAGAAGSTVARKWLGCWIILVSACFGVVLEGPMGAVVFWTLLGLANGSAGAAAEPAPELAANVQPETSELVARVS